MSRTKSAKGGGATPLPPLLCPRCGKPASAKHFKRYKACAAVVARLRAMLNVSQRKRVVPGPGRGHKKPASKKPGGTKS